MDLNNYKYKTKEIDRISLHDSLVDRIKVNENRIELLFNNGFYVIDALCSEEILSKRAKLVIGSFLDVDCISCKKFRRFKSPSGEKIVGREIDIHTISSQLENSRFKILLVDTLRGYNHIFLRGTIFPYKKYGLPDMIEIEIIGYSEIEYLWN